ncbi:MAG TPA: GNAT family N-acyltransferase [Vicinamibacterales bacterium]|nr:GNAT family N-acyltransferase [Vicinamibacterales bacterium]
MSPESDAVGRAVAADLLTWLRPLRFDEASDERECREAFRLRCRAVVEGGMDTADRFPDGLERDAHDADAVQLIGWDGDQAVATCRLVFARSGRPFPLETAFALALPSRERTVEWGRVTIDSSRRGEGHRLVMGLAARGWLAMEARGATVAIGVTPERLVAFLSTLGFPLTALGPPRVYWGEERVPIQCEGVHAAAALSRLWGSVKTESGQEPEVGS